MENKQITKEQDIELRKTCIKYAIESRHGLDGFIVTAPPPEHSNVPAQKSIVEMATEFYGFIMDWED